MLIERNVAGDCSKIQCDVCRKVSESTPEEPCPWAEWLSFDDVGEYGATVWLPRGPGDDSFWAKLSDVDICSPECTVRYFWEITRNQKVHKPA